MSGPRTAAELLRTVGLLADGPVVWGRPVPESRPGVYLVELPAPLPSAPLELTRIGSWLERASDLRLDGERPASKALAARLGAYWLPDQTVLFIASTGGSLRARIAALQKTALGDPKPYAGGHWLMTLRGIETARVWWAATDAPQEYEDALLDAFAERVPPEARRGLREPELVLPFAVLRRPTGERRQHGISGALLPESAVTPSALPPSTAAKPAAPKRAAPGARRGPKVSVPGGPPGPPKEAPVHLSAEGLERLEAELLELRGVRRPATVRRVATAREHGDLRENAEYHAAREELGFIDGRIQMLEARLRNAVIVEASSAATAGLGSRVVIEGESGVHEYRLVGSTEANPAAGRLSTSSPVGRAVIGHVAGDEVVVQTPAGERRFRIVEVG